MVVEKLECDVCTNNPTNEEISCEVCGVIFCSEKCLEIHKKNFDIVLKNSKGWAE